MLPWVSVTAQIPHSDLDHLTHRVYLPDFKIKETLPEFLVILAKIPKRLRRHVLFARHFQTNPAIPMHFVAPSAANGCAVRH